MNIKQIKTLDELTKLYEENKLEGLFQMDEDLYRKAPGLNQSSLKEYKKSPADYLLMKLKPKVTKALDEGKLFDILITRKNEFKKNYIIGEELNKNTKIWKEFVASNPNKICLKPSELSKSGQWVSNFMSHPKSKTILKDVYYQVAFFFNDGKRIRKGMIDFIDKKGIYIGDIKTAKDASYRGFEKSNHDYRYYMQAGWYYSSVFKFMPNLKDYYLGMCEKTSMRFNESSKVAWYLYGNYELEKGLEDCESVIENFERSAITGVYAGYPDVIQIGKLPDWCMGWNDKEDNILLT